MSRLPAPVRVRPETERLRHAASVSGSGDDAVTPAPGLIVTVPIVVRKISIPVWHNKASLAPDPTISLCVNNQLYDCAKSGANVQTIKYLAV